MASPLDTALAHLEGERYPQAEALLRRVLQRSPGDGDACRLMGVVLARTGRIDQARFHFQRAIAAAPGSGLAHLNFGNAEFAAANHAAAAILLRRAAELMPGSFEAHNSLCGAATACGEFDDALRAGQRAVSLAPGHASGLFNLGACLTASGDAAEGLRALESAAAIAPGDPHLLSTLLMISNYDPGRSARRRFEEHRTLGERIAGAFAPPRPIGRSAAAADDPLRVGFLSADLRNHVVAVFMRGLLSGRSASGGGGAGLEALAYQTGPMDGVSEQLRPLFDRWTHAQHLTDEELVERMRADRLDALVDLSGHTDGSRPGVIAMRGAPVQVNYLGYPSTTGLPTMDARLVDGVTDPDGSDGLATERLVRLGRCFLAFAPPVDAPAPKPRAAGHAVVFGSFNAAPKVNPPLLRLWARIMLLVPGSRLLIKNRGLGCSRTREHWTAVLAEAGVSADRVDLRGWEATPAHHLAAYHEVDVALDTWPYHGTTTTCEALWMGVPVVSLASEGHVSRVGASLLGAIGQGALVATTEESYVMLSAGLAGDPDRRAALRTGLRAAVASSPLCDGPGLFSAVTAALRALCRA